MTRYQDYKESGIDWIGEIPKDWEMTVLKRTAYLKGRIGWQGLTSEEYEREGEYALVTGTEFQDGRVDWNNCWFVDQERYQEDLYIQLQKDDLLITKDGTIGKIAHIDQLPKPATLNSGVFVLRPLKNSFVPRFMFWALRSDLFPQYIEYSKVGTTIAHLYQKTFERFVYPLPSQDEQEQISVYLDKQCAIIDKVLKIKEEQLTILENLRKSIIHKAVTKGLDDGVDLVDSGIEWIGKMPKKWKVDRIKDVVSLRNTKTDEKDEIENYIELEDMDQKTGRLLSVRNTIGVESDVIVFEKGDVLFGKLRPYLEKHYYAEFNGRCTGEIFAFKPERIDDKYFYYCVASPWFISRCDVLSYGAKMPRVNWPTQIAVMDMPIPPYDDQTEIANFLDKEIKGIFSLMDNIKQQIDVLEGYRKSLIHECITGKRRITDQDLKELTNV